MVARGVPGGVVRALAVTLALAAGCVGEPAPDAPRLALPSVGDSATYAVSGTLVELARWSTGVPLLDGARLTLTVEDEPALALDGYRARHAAYRVREELANGAGAAAPHRTLWVADATHEIVQSFVPTGGEDATVAWDERGYPWAWGASRLQGLALAGGHDDALPANDGGPGPRALRFEVGARERVGAHDAYRVDVRGAGAWTFWVVPEIPVPVAVSVNVDPGDVEPFVRPASDAPVAFRADLESFTRGAGTLPPRDDGVAYVTEPTNPAFEPWDGEVPPDGAGSTYAPFLLADAVAHAKSTDLPFRRWLDAAPEAILYRATYFAVPGALPGSVNHTWLVVYVSPEDAYWAVQVERTLVTGSPLPGVTRVASSAAASAPAGEHGWFATADLPESLFTIDAAIGLLRETFRPDGIEIFLRSFVDPPGYAYYVDGGFEAGKRYTLIVNAQTGFMQAATGPVEPVLE